MNFRALSYFVASAETLHISRAAEQLGIAQPALSQQIKSLEAELGVRLFHRTNRRVELTDAGRVFLAEARQILSASDHAVRLAREAGQGNAGELNIGYNGSVIFEPLLHRLLTRFRSSYPNVTLAMHEERVEPLLETFHEGKLDIAFVRGPIGSLPPGINKTSFVRSPLVAALPADHALASHTPIPVRELAEEAFIALMDPPGVGLAHSLYQLGESAGFTPKVALRAGSVMSVLGLVGAGLGISVIPRLALEFSSSSFVLRELDNPEAETEVLMLARNRVSSPVENRFLKMVHTEK